ncbi:MAG: VOC family protein [Parasphingorhabdus sp.]|uniref:VOC family protein n=1 Tax=Parasphingorhabdus sp. TaxID=2709688 RepID=UPI003297CDFE
MSVDIFVPQSNADDAIVGPLQMVTYVTDDRATVEKIFTQGYGLQNSGWHTLSDHKLVRANAYFGFEENQKWQSCTFYKSGAGANVQIRVMALETTAPLVRPAYDGLYAGGATMSFPINDLHAHEKHMMTIGIESTIGVKEMEFASPSGETYISAEIVYKAPDNIFVMGVVRPDIFVPVGPIDPATGMGGAAYSARCISAADDTIAFFRDILGFEIRRDVEFTVGERSALLMPEGTTERFVQAFAPGSASGYLVLMDHMESTKPSPASSYGPPNRGIAMWSFAAKDIEHIQQRAERSNIEIVHPAAVHDSLFLPEVRSMILKDPDGFLIEIFEE